MNIKQELNLLLEDLALKTESELLEISKLRFVSDWELCVKNETVFITIEKKAQKYKLLSYDLYPCYRLFKISDSLRARLTFRLNEAEYEVLDEAMEEFYDTYCERFSFPTKHYSNMNHGMRVFKIHTIFLANRLAPIITEYCIKNRVPFEKPINMKISIIQADITTLTVDAIVNAANKSLLGGGGVDGAIHRKGGAQILAECMAIREKQGGCKVGEAVLTTAGNLPSKFVIHTVGPIWNRGNHKEAELLANCYTNSLNIAFKNGFKTIAFPNISTGVYHFPKDLAAQIALETVQRHEHFNAFDEIVFCCFDEENYEIYNSLEVKL